MAVALKRRKIQADIDMTPLIDVVFQLLIFLMVSSQFVKPDTVVDLPMAGKGAPQVETEREKIKLAISADGVITMDGEKITLDALPVAIAEATALMDDKRAELRGDEASQFGLFVKVMEIARENGVESLGIVKKEEPDAP